MNILAVAWVVGEPNIRVLWWCCAGNGTGPGKTVQRGCSLVQQPLSYRNEQALSSEKVFPQEKFPLMFDERFALHKDFRIFLNHRVME